MQNSSDYTVARPSVAVVMPAYNEAEGIAGFLQEIDEAVLPYASNLHFIIVDDASTEPLEAWLQSAGEHLSGTVDVQTNSVNLGHGPSALRAYRAGLAAGADLIIHVDGDGQFSGSDFPTIIQMLWLREAQVVRTVRADRKEVWYRSVITSLLRIAFKLLNCETRDVNSPLRGFRREVLGPLLEQVPADSLIPNIHLTLAERASGLTSLEVEVAHRPRRGSVTSGSTWGCPSRLALPPVELVSFCVQALQELRVARRDRATPRLGPPTGQARVFEH